MIQRLRAIVERAVRRQAVRAADADAHWRRITNRPPQVIHASPADLASELFWTLHIDPVAREYGIECPTALRRVLPDDHVLERPNGELVLIVRVDRECS
ncbi:hypothetical protein ACFQS1_19790 [Paractinoplanes rhizophilus]|uniref:Uncharacterized protein n=1 Tax=Paractinoplanes rhizophilus TaxID=1416877 RepID=A0ABW2HUE5_9ACTN